MNHANANENLRPEGSITEEFNRVLTEHLPSQDELEFELGDTLDIKMSIVLVVIIFLATQSGGFLASSMPRHWHIIQIISVCALVVAGVLALWELIPREYKLRMGQDEFLAWVEKLKTFYNHEGVQNPEIRMIEFIRSKDIQRTRERIAVNKSINKRKSWAMEWSFYSTMIAVALNLTTLLALSWGWKF